MQKRWLKILVAVAAFFVAVVVLVPFFVNADTFRPKIESELSSALGRKVTLGHLGLSLLTGSLVADNISIADDPAFSTAPFLDAKELRIGVELSRLLFHHSLQVTDLIVKSPSIQLIHATNGTWNFSTLGGAATKPSPTPTASADAMPALTVNKLAIENGSAVLSSLPADGKPLQCTDVNLTVTQFSPTASFPFTLSLQVPGGGSLSLKGAAGPLAQNDASLTPFHATISVKHFDPVAAGAIQAGDGISMLADLDAQVASQDAKLSASGKAKASQLKLAANGVPAPRPVDINFNLADDLSSRNGRVNDLAIVTGAVAAHITGTFQQSGTEPSVNLQLAAPNLPVDQVEQLLPAAGVVLPSGSRLQGGTINANLAISGPVNGLTIAGPIELDNSQLTGFDLGGKIQGIHPLAGTSGGTEIQKLYAVVNNSPQGTSFQNIDAEIPKIGSATGQGTISPSPTEALNFQMSAKIAALSAVGGAVDKLFGGGSSSSSNSGGGGIPLTVTGTASNPSIHANLGQMFKNATNGVVNNSGMKNSVKSLKGLFGR